MTAISFAPLVFAPTQQGFGLHCILSSGSPTDLVVRMRVHDGTWGSLVPPTTTSADTARWTIVGLSASMLYDYEVRTVSDNTLLYSASTSTLRSTGDSIRFSILSDLHIVPSPSPASTQQAQGIATLQAANASLATNPDFVVCLGDATGYPDSGFNYPAPDTATARAAYFNYRGCLGALSAYAPVFHVNGNWDGEPGYVDPSQVINARSQRLLYFPGPLSSTYPFGGSAHEDYYAFESGSALCVILNVESYTTTDHTRLGLSGTASNWTLGATQLAWLATVLQSSSAKWKFLFCHHPVGGNGVDERNSIYGRGGGRAANVGEQAIIHGLMQTYGAQVFFYGHDHVFTDMLVGSVHYKEVTTSGDYIAFSPTFGGYSPGTYWSGGGWTDVLVTPDRILIQSRASTNGVLIEEQAVRYWAANHTGTYLKGSTGLRLLTRGGSYLKTH